MNQPSDDFVALSESFNDNVILLCFGLLQRLSQLRNRGIATERMADLEWDDLDDGADGSPPLCVRKWDIYPNMMWLVLQ